MSSVRLVVATLALAIAAHPAVALTPDQIDWQLKQANPACTVATRVFGTGLIKGLGAPLTLVELRRENCGGTPGATARLVGVYERAGKPTVVEAPSYMGAPEGVKIVGDRIVAYTLEAGPGDPPCCPTRRRTVQLVFANGKLIQSR